MMKNFNKIFKSLFKDTNSVKKNIDELYLLRQFTRTRDYSADITKIRSTDIDFMLNQYKNLIDYHDLLILSKFNDNNYPFFDIDELSKYNHFCRTTNHNYVSFQSSPGHFWVIIDEPFKNVADMVKNPLYSDWLVYSDNRYVSMCIERDDFYIRGTFKTLDRQPVIVNKIGTFSDEFKLFIFKLNEHFETNGLELSLLRYKDPEMLVQHKRVKKLSRILKK